MGMCVTEPFTAVLLTSAPSQNQMMLMEHPNPLAIPTQSLYLRHPNSLSWVFTATRYNSSSWWCQRSKQFQCIVVCTNMYLGQLILEWQSLNQRACNLIIPNSGCFSNFRDWCMVCTFAWCFYLFKIITCDCCVNTHCETWILNWTVVIKDREDEAVNSHFKLKCALEVTG